MMKSTIKKLIKKLFYIKILNLLIRYLFKPIFQFLPSKIRNKVINIPVIGRINLLLPNSKSLIFESDGSDSIATRLYWKGLHGFEPATISLFMKLLNCAQVVFDIGANTGLYALIAAMDNLEREVYAFEPVPKIFQCLKKNIEINKLNNLTPVHGAVTNYDGNISLYIPSSDHKIPVTASTLPGFREPSEIISVPGLTIDSFVSKSNISRVNLIKVDTEGTEHKVFQGAKNVIKRDNPIIICEVLKGRTEVFLQEIFDSSGYKFFLITELGLIQKDRIEGDKTYKNMNYLFIPEKKISEVLPQICYSLSLL